MKNEKGRTKGLIIWSCFVAIMIIVVCASVLRFVFNVDFSGKTINETEKVIAKNEANTNKPATKPSSKTQTEEVEVVPTMNDNISGDTIWVPTFQLVWNDLIDQIVGHEIVFNEKDENLDILKNLNAKIFEEKDISTEYIFKKIGETSNDLKEEILNGIKEKFNENSDLIDESEDWDIQTKEGMKSYTIYAMLCRNFEFTEPFDKYEKEEGYFGKNKEYSNVEYFGIDSKSSSKLYSQVTILYYDNEENFAFMVDTKNGDQLIYSRGINGNNFDDIYSKINSKASTYSERKEFNGLDRLKIPVLDVNVLKEYDEVTDKEFDIDENIKGKISKALQSIKFSLDNEGGKIKSEAMIEMKTLSAEIEEVVEVEPPLSYDLYLVDEFTMFVKEKDKDKPYFALNVSDISKYQEDVEKTN